MRIGLCLILLCCIVANAKAQDPIWWYNNVNWDGISHWSSYITSSAGMLGPNGLPVPTLTTGRADSVSSVELGFVSHYRKGDYTKNITSQLNLNLVKERVSLNLYMVPIEWFNVSHALKEERRIFYQHYNESNATGDLYINTNFQFLRQRKHNLDAAFRIGLKTATSNNQGAARFTNAPGYYFDVSAGKSWSVANSTLRHRLQLMLGFYAWQTNQHRQQQDDAFLYGAGYQVDLNKLTFEQSISGYYGYLNNGDRPVIYKAKVSKRMGDFTSALYYWHGLHDYIYKCIGLNLNYTFSGKALLK